MKRNFRKRSRHSKPKALKAIWLATLMLVVAALVATVVLNDPDGNEEVPKCVSCHRVQVFDSVDEARASALTLIYMGYNVEWDVEGEPLWKEGGEK